MDRLLTDLLAFLGEHRGCATELAGGMLDDHADDSACVVWLACDACGVRIVRKA